MQIVLLARLAPLIAGAVMAMSSVAFAQDKPVTPPDSYRIVMENDRVRIIEVHIKAHSKVEVDSPGNRERFLYMLSDGALILAPPGKKPYEFALNAGETAVFPAISPTVENDTDSPVRALMVEVKEGGRSVAGGKKGRLAGKRSGHGKVAVRSTGRSKAVRTVSPKSKTKSAAKPQKTEPVAAKPNVKPPLNLSKAASKPARKVTGRGRDSDG